MAYFNQDDCMDMTNTALRTSSTEVTLERRFLSSSYRTPSLVNLLRCRSVPGISTSRKMFVASMVTLFRLNWTARG